MSALLLNMYTTNAGELLLESPFGGCGSKLSGWTQTSIPIALHKAPFSKHRSLQVSGLRPFRLIQEITVLVSAGIELIFFLVAGAVLFWI